MSLLIDCLLDLHEIDAAWLYKGIEQGLSMSKWREKYVSKYSKIMQQSYGMKYSVITKIAKMFNVAYAKLGTNN